MVVMSLMACSSQLHVVTLYVDTTQIDQDNIDANAHFGQRVGIANKDFTTDVRKRDIVIWQGVSTSDTLHMVTITSIKHESGDYLIDQRVAKTNRANQRVAKTNRAKKMNNKQFIRKKIVARPSREQPFAKEKYTLKFTVFNNKTKRNGTFQIDPVIKGHQ